MNPVECVKPRYNSPGHHLGSATHMRGVMQPPPMPHEGPHSMAQHALLRLLLLLPVLSSGLMACDVLQHHLHGTRDGLYMDPRVTQAAAARTRRDTTFRAPLPGPTYAQPLYVTRGPGGRAAVIAVTEA